MLCSCASCNLLILLALLAVGTLISDVQGRSSSTQAASRRTSSAWLKSVGHNPRPRPGCWNRPWICDQEGEEEEEEGEDENENGGVKQFPPFHRKMCCKNRCIDVTSDVYNCGLCGIRCPFTWQCCNGICIDVNVNPFHCGQCWNRCKLGSLCFYGMCGYAQLPPFPFPFPPKPPHPPPYSLPFPHKPSKQLSSPPA